MNKYIPEIDVSRCLTEDNAREYVFCERPIIFDNSKIWWFWDKINSKWIKTDDTEIILDINRCGFLIKNKHHPIVRKQIFNLLEIVAREKFKKIKELNEISPFKSNNGFVCFKNCIRQIGYNNNFSISSEYFITSTIPFNFKDQNYNEELDCPNIDKLFIDWVGKDNKEILYQIIGYCMVEGYPLHRLFCLLGNGHNGKSTFLKIIEKVVGIDNLAISSLDQIQNNRFELANLQYKLVCVVGETNLELLKNTDTLKKLTGEDLISTDVKLKNNIYFKNNAKIIIAANQLPLTTDKSDAFFSRWQIVDFNNQFYENKDVLSQISIEELESLANICYKKIEKVIVITKEFHNQGSIAVRRQRFEEKSDPLTKFLEENYCFEINGKVLISEFYDKALAYFAKNNYRIITKQAITSFLISNCGIDKGKTYVDGKLAWCYLGITEKSPAIKK